MAQALPDGFDWKAESVKRRQTLLDKIPETWRISTELLGELKTPLESSDNNVLEMDFVRRSGVMSDGDIAITESTMTELLTKLASGELTSYRVTTAFCKRAAIAHQLINCCTETFFDEALKRAKDLDTRRESGETLGPLHGMPISVKDNVQIEGVGATIGLVAFFNDKSDRNSAIVDILLGQGAVLYCKTNIPQTMMTVDSENNIFGRTLNPLNTSLSAGGSSGGEGALVGFRGSLLGIGTDVGGSVRYPAASCGVYGFRPTVGRIPAGDLKTCTDSGMRPIRSCVGPLAHDVDSLILFMKLVVGARPWNLDPTMFDLPWREAKLEEGKKLRIGVMAVDDAFPLQPPVRRAVERATAKLQAAGHEIVPLKKTECRAADAAVVAFALFSMDPTGTKIADSTGEPPIPSRATLQAGVMGLNWSYLAEAMGISDGLTRLSALNRKRAEIAASWHKIFTEKKLDVVLGPIMQHTAAEHDKFAGPGYGTIFNLLDYPACTIPVEKASAADAEPFEVKESQWCAEYKPEKCEGMPVSIQLVTPTMRDEECLEIAKLVDALLNKA